MGDLKLAVLGQSEEDMVMSISAEEPVPEVAEVSQVQLDEEVSLF